MKKLLVLIRETFPTDELLTEKNLKEKRILNPYDEYALLQAKKIKEKYGGEIVCLFLSHRKTQYGLRTALGLGGDRGIFVYYPEKNIEEIAEILAREIKEEKYDAVLMGNRDVNDDREELPSRLGVLLKLPIYSHLLSIDCQNFYFTAKREREEIIDTIKILKNGIFAFSQNVYEPEYPSISRIMSIKNKTVRDVYYENIISKEDEEIVYQDIYRRLEIYKNITADKGTEKLLDYMKKWKLID